MPIPIAQRFRGFLPVIIDVETAGFNPKTDALLELAAVFIAQDDKGDFFQTENYHQHIEPFKGANMEKAALDFTGLDPTHPFRFAIDEEKALMGLFKAVRTQMKLNQCQRAVLVGHNPMFDLSFVQAACERIHYKRTPFHGFTTFDTATLGGMAFGQTVLAKAVKAAGLDFDDTQAHGALYDADRTAALFCHIVNQWKENIHKMPAQTHPLYP